MGGIRRGWTLVGLLLTVWMGAARAQVATTTVQDTVYRADGTAAGGSVVVSWSAFTTASGSSVPAGTTSATIGAGGLLTLSLAPNAGAAPMGSYYTAVYHLNDGSTSREFWVIPATVAGGLPVKLATIRNSVLPLSVAMQTVSKSYVDTAIAAAVTGHPLDTSSPYVLKTGDTMTGPLVLPGDPVSANQAADKNYVDVNVAATAAGLGRKVDELPGTTQVVAQPAGTDLEVNNLNGQLYARQYVSGFGNNGIGNALAGSDCAGGCNVVAEQTYASAEQAGAAQIPRLGRVTDLRGGGEAKTMVDPLNPTMNGISVGEGINITSTRGTAETMALVPGAVAADSIGLRIRSQGLTGGSNQFPQDVEAVPYFKTTYSGLDIAGTYNTQGQHVLSGAQNNCYGVGDCLIGAQVILASGGMRDEADEGAHPFDIQISEDPAVFTGTCSTGCTTGATTLNVSVTGGGGTQGDGRFLIDTNPAKVISAGTLTGGHTAVPFAVADFSGTSFSTSVFLTTASAATSQPTNLAPGTVTLGIATTGVAAGYVTNTAAIAATGVACIADPHPVGSAGFANYEMARYTVVDGTHVRLTLNKVHASGATIAVGGLCGYGLEQKVDTTYGIRQVFPVVGSPTATELYYTDASTPVVGVSQATSAFVNFSSAIASIARTGNVITVTTASFIPYDLSGLTLTVSGVADSSYNGNFVVTSTGNFTLTYANTGADSTSSGGTIGIVTGGFGLYPMAEVLSVYNPATKAVDGYLSLGANTVAWAAGDPVEEPHYFQENVGGDIQFITQYVPRPTQYSRAGIQYQGNVGPSLRGWSVNNAVGLGNYFGNGGTHSLPDTAYEATGFWKNILITQAGDESLFRVYCNSHGCNKWNSSYNLFELDRGTGGADLLTYQPQTSTALWALGGSVYQFSPTAFTAGTINVGTLNATTITGGVSGGAITTGTISAARLPVFGPSGTTHGAGIVPDPGTTAGTTRFLREDGTFAVPAGGSGTATVPATAASCSGSYTIAFAATGDIAYDLTLTANCTISLAAPASSTTYRKLTLFIRPAGFTATLPASSAAVAWRGGTAPTPSTTNLTVITFGSTGTAPVAGDI